MSEQPEFVWPGDSGKKYTYRSFELPFSCDPNQDGNYIFTKSEAGKWVPIYIGQGDLNNRTNDPKHYKCATSKGATHVHLHLNPSKQDRLSEEDDLLEAFPQAYAPVGCNEKIGG